MANEAMAQMIWRCPHRRNDVVEYRLPQPLGGATLGLGRVEEMELEAGRVTLAPLELEPVRGRVS